MAEELTAKDVIRAHARDELGIDIDDMSSPLQASVASMLSFLVGAGLPLLAAAFIRDQTRSHPSLSTSPLVSHPQCRIFACPLFPPLSHLSTFPTSPVTKRYVGMHKSVSVAREQQPPWTSSRQAIAWHVRTPF